MFELASRSESDAASRVLTSLRQLFATSEQIFRDEAVPFENAFPLPQTPSREPPSYFKSLLTLDETKNPIDRERVVRSVAKENPDIDGIVLASDRREDERHDGH